MPWPVTHQALAFRLIPLSREFQWVTMRGGYPREIPPGPNQGQAVTAKGQGGRVRTEFPLTRCKLMFHSENNSFDFDTVWTTASGCVETDNWKKSWRSLFVGMVLRASRW